MLCVVIHAEWCVWRTMLGEVMVGREMSPLKASVFTLVRGVWFQLPAVATVIIREGRVRKLEQSTPSYLHVPATKVVM